MGTNPGFKWGGLILRENAKGIGIQNRAVGWDITPVLQKALARSAAMNGDRAATSSTN